MRVRSRSVVSIMWSVPAAPRCSAKVSAASSAPNVPPNRRDVVLARSLGYIAAPSVATVMTASSGPESSSFTVLMAARTLAIEERPRCPSDATMSSGTPLRRARNPRPPGC